MLWILVLHIVALLFWCAALLYLPALIAGMHAGRTEITASPRRHDSVARFVFTHVATPAALLAIISGTAVFLVGNIVELWLIAKLALVLALVVAHALSGLLVLRLEDEAALPVQPWCWILAVTLCSLMAAIIWIVLAKPPLEWIPWRL
jgi:protoporphyrinogen IX oxidase